MGDIAFSCPVSRECGGCELLATPYPVQLERKTRAMERLYEPVCRACDVSVEPVLGMDEPRGYRYKAATPLAPGKRHSVRCGFYARGTHEIVRCPECAVEAPGARQMLNRVAYAIERLRMENAHTGVSWNVSQSGVMMLPPAEREYAVEPVGVVTISPSAMNSPA